MRSSDFCRLSLLSFKVDFSRAFDAIRTYTRGEGYRLIMSSAVPDITHFTSFISTRWDRLQTPLLEFSVQRTRSLLGRYLNWLSRLKKRQRRLYASMLPLNDPFEPIEMWRIHLIVPRVTIINDFKYSRRQSTISLIPQTFQQLS